MVYADQVYSSALDKNLDDALERIERRLASLEKVVVGILDRERNGAE